MKLEQQVCSLELAKRLKELEVIQQSLWYWQRFNSMGKLKWALSNTTNSHCVSAFTVAELGEMLPVIVKAGKRGLNSEMLSITKGHFGDAPEISWQVMYYDVKFFNAATEADARAKMLIYLLENKLITLP